MTGRCVFSFDRARARFTLGSTHPGETPASVRGATGFAYDEPGVVPVTAGLSDAQRAALQGRIASRTRHDLPGVRRLAARVTASGSIAGGPASRRLSPIEIRRGVRAR